MIFLLLCCKQHVEEEICKEIPPAPIGFGYNFVSLAQNSIGPACFNPNNEDEFVYYGKIDSFHSGLIIYNLKTESKRAIYYGSVAYQPKWGVNDWILLNRPDHQIWKIKSTGKNLTQLSFKGSNFSPEWNKTATLITWHNASIQKYVIADSDGIPIDTINYGGGGIPCWQHDSLMAGVGPSWAFVTNPVTDTFEFKYEYPNPTGYFGSAQWISEDQFIWSYEKGIYVSNYRTGETKEIKSLCNSESYFYPTYAYNSGKVLFLVVHRKLVNTNTLGITRQFVIMNMDGTDEKIIHLNE